VRCTPKMSTLARVGPVPGLGPALPESGPGADGVRLAVAVELEAARLHVHKGKHFRGGKVIRSWLISWLPSGGAADFAMLLACWPKDMLLEEDLERGRLGETAYSAITVGQGLRLQFPEDGPLPVSELQALREMHLAVCQAYRTGAIEEDSLPQLDKLREWGRCHLSSARATTKMPTAEERGAKVLRYSHRRGFGAVTMSEPPSRHLGTTGSGLHPEGSGEDDGMEEESEEDEEPPPWDTECIVDSRRQRLAPGGLEAWQVGEAEADGSPAPPLPPPPPPEPSWQPLPPPVRELPPPFPEPELTPPGGGA